MLTSPSAGGPNRRSFCPAPPRPARPHARTPRARSWWWAPTLRRMTTLSSAATPTSTGDDHRPALGLEAQRLTCVERAFADVWMPCLVPPHSPGSRVCTAVCAHPVLTRMRGPCMHASGMHACAAIPPPHPLIQGQGTCDGCACPLAAQRLIEIGGASATCIIVSQAWRP